MSTEPGPTAADRWFTRWFGDGQSRRFGEGWIAGVLGVFLGAAALLAVLCLRFPERLTSPFIRELLPLPVVRGAIALAILGALLGGALNLALRRRKRLGLTGIALALGAVTCGGPGVQVADPTRVAVWFGVDWFVLQIVTTALVFVPIERGWPLRPAQRVFRSAWTTDGAWFVASHLAVQVLSFLIVTPASAIAVQFAMPGLRATVAALPLVVQVALAVFVADLVQYWVHRAFHRVPWLWRFHRVHHSVETMDWLAGSRLHFVDIVATRGAVLAALLTVGIAPAALAGYLVFVGAHAVFVHANFAPRTAWLERLVVMPRFHHWHHAADPRAVDRNFAVHLPWLDRVFGSHFLPPTEWPSHYGLLGERAPRGWLAQLGWPFRA